MHPLIKILLISIVIRLAPIIIIDQFQNINQHRLWLTDIDYKVYTDAAATQNPYHRHTYRYTPLLAYLMKFNQVWAPAGKLILTFFDVVAVILLYRLLLKTYEEKPLEMQKILTVCKLYAYNPLFIGLTVRGSCQSITCCLMLGFWLCYLQISGNSKKAYQSKMNIRMLIAYVLYGLWVHFRVYPIILLPLILAHKYRMHRVSALPKTLSQVINFGLISGGVFLGLAYIFYSLYGQQFITETYLHHFTRKDNRHSFSPHFYEIYLSQGVNTPSKSILRMLPLVIVMVSVVFKSKSSIFMGQFFLVLAFVNFNTVITMQYYQWIGVCLLLVLPESAILRLDMYRKGFQLLIQWVLGVGLWIWMAGKLQGNGQNVFLVLWMVCIFKIGLDIWVFSGFMKTTGKHMFALERFQKFQKLQTAKRILSGANSNNQKKKKKK